MLPPTTTACAPSVGTALRSYGETALSVIRTTTLRIDTVMERDRINVAVARVGSPTPRHRVGGRSTRRRPTAVTGPFLSAAGVIVEPYG
jgi:hypothetical protein